MNNSQSGQPNLRNIGYFQSLASMHLLCLLIDIIINTFSNRMIYFATRDQNLFLIIVVYAIQMIVILVNLLLLVTAFTNTQPFRAGLLKLLVNCNPCPGSIVPENRISGDFTSAISISLGYFLIVTLTRVWVIIRFLIPCSRANTAVYIDKISASGVTTQVRSTVVHVCYAALSSDYRILTALMMTASLAYYYRFKRAVVDICDQRYYRADSNWLSEKIGELHQGQR